MHSTAVRDHYAVLWLSGLYRPLQLFDVGRDGGGPGMQRRIGGGVRGRLLRRTSAGGEIRIIHSFEQERARLGRSLFRALWRCHCLYKQAPASDPHIYRAACGDRTNAAAAISCLYVYWLVAVVPGPGIPGHEGGRKLALSGEVLPRVRQGDRRDISRAPHLVCVVALEAPDKSHSIVTHSFLLAPNVGIGAVDPILA